MRNHPRRKTAAQSLLVGSHSLVPLAPSNDNTHIQPTLQSIAPLPPTDQIFNPDRQILESSEQHLQPVIPRSKSLGPDAPRQAYRHARRPRRDASLSSSLLIKAYLKNPVNPVPRPAPPQKTGTLGIMEQARASTSAGGPAASSSHTKPSWTPAERCSPPRLNGPFLRIRSGEDHDSRRVDRLLYGPVDPALVDPTIDRPIYYTFPALEEAFLAPTNCHESDLFDPVILHPSFTPLPSNAPIPPPYVPSLSSPLSQSSALYPWDAKKGIGPLNVH